VRKSLKFVSIDEKHCNEKDFGACALRLYLNFKSVCIVTIYRAPSGIFNSFMSKLDMILRKLYSSMLEYIVCGDININYLTDSEKNSQLVSLLQTYNLTSSVDFPTRITAIDNNFIDIARRDSYSICPVINGLIVMHSQ
jgi:exonuclease III